MPGLCGDSCLSSVRFGFGRQRGAAVMLAILALAVMAEIAALAIADYGATNELLIGRQDQAQSRWLARAAIDWGRNVLSEDARTSKIDHPGELWTTHIAPTPIEDGEVAGEITDCSGLFNLNGLVANGRPLPDQVAAYVRLLQNVGISPAEAEQLAAALLDWLDVDDLRQSGGSEQDEYSKKKGHYLPANAPLLDVDELILVSGYTEPLLARLRPFVVALPEVTPLNVNFAPAEVLSAVVKNLGLDEARALAANRVTEPFKDTQAFLDQLPSHVSAPASTILGVTSRYFLVGGRAKYGDAVSRMQVLLDRKERWSIIVWQKIL